MEKAEFWQLHINFTVGKNIKKCTQAAEADTLATMERGHISKSSEYLGEQWKICKE